MSDQQELDNTVIGDDGLTDREREFIQTPVTKLSPESVQHGMAMLEKRANFNYEQNEIYRRDHAEKIKGQYAE